MIDSAAKKCGHAFVPIFSLLWFLVFYIWHFTWTGMWSVWIEKMNLSKTEDHKLKFGWVKIRVCFNASFVPILWTKCDACWSLSVGHDHFIVNFLPYNGAELIFILNLGSWPFYICQSSLEYLIKGILNSEGVGIWTSFPLFDEKAFSDGKSHILNQPF